ncbi:Nin one binding Zn-ribbon like-domain-containing protein [Boeremia exigua]|uniref:Nin one binding Zn-ribbon like-domain-containing protein n=1 Tax=Boeremia exigua TaxID=749465 RepID=UPI001E8DB961|nr:Nin one binding Zn-ribbon like-domain-containing protein [Boeremia exigua]KAH6638865.1 Nin one binding Zn-ribbon like-domain-containing protein [Boeremia exigua]
MAVEPTQKPIHSLILDTGPLIKNVVSISTIINSAEELYTTPAIISEIRDEATRMRVQTTLMPFLKVRNPSPASYDAVIAFSKKTGDHAVLSRQDLGILALAYEIHCERNSGDWGLRSVPKGPIKLRPEEEEEARKQQEAKAAAKAAQEQADLESGQIDEEDEWSTVTKSKKLKKSKGQNKKNKPEQAQTEEMILEQPATEAEPQQKPEEPVVQEAVQEQPASLLTEEKPVEVESTSESAAESLEKDMTSLEISNEAQEPTPPASDDEDDNDGDWITETNLPEHQIKDSTIQASVRAQGPTQMDVATMTIDFAMQNVLLQMNLKLITTNMQRIKKLSSKVLRCHACFQIVKDMSKQFCPRCGGATLARVSCSTNAKGEFHIHLAKNYTYNKRGDKFSIPKPIAGTANTKWSGIGGGKGGWGRDLVLAEDQKEFTRQLTKDKRERASDLMDQDYLPGILTGDRGRAGGRVKVGAGKNVNAKKGR